GVAAHVVVGVRMERLAVLILPDLLSVVARIEDDGLRAPVFFFAADEIASLDHQDALAGRRQSVSQRASSGAGTDDDDVVVRGLRHGVSPQTRVSASSAFKSSPKRHRKMQGAVLW